MAYSICEEDIVNIKSLWHKWFNQIPDKSRESQVNLGELDTDIDEIEMPDGTKFKIPEMPPSRPHWG